MPAQDRTSDETNDSGEASSPPPPLFVVSDDDNQRAIIDERDLLQTLIGRLRATDSEEEQPNRSDPLSFPVPDFTSSITDINRSLNSIQADISQLSSIDQSSNNNREQAEDEEEEEGEEVDDLFGLSELDAHMDNIDQALTKLDQENAQLQDRLLGLLSLLRDQNSQQQPQRQQQSSQNQ